MNVTITEHDRYMLATLEGPLDETCKAPFDDQLHPIIEMPGSRLAVDLSAVPRVTSAGLGVMVTLVSRANTKGSQVVLAQPTAFVSSVLQVTKLVNFFDVAPTLSDAIERFSA